MQLDGVFIDMYGTITTGDRHAVETVCGRIIRDTGLAMAAPELAITWGNRFFAALDTCNDERFKTLYEIERDTLRETMEELGAPVDPVPYADELARYWQAPPLQPEVRTFFAEFGLPTCVVSNADRADIDAVIARWELPVAHVVTSEDARSYKPAPRIFEIALEQTGWRRDRVLHVGDSLHSDVGGAIATGIRSVWVNREHRIHDVGNHDPDYEIADLLGLAKLIQSRQASANEPPRRPPAIEAE